MELRKLWHAVTRAQRAEHQAALAVLAGRMRGHPRLADEAAYDRAARRRTAARATFDAAFDAAFRAASR